MLEHTEIFGVKPVILVVTQDSALRQLLHQTLERHGFEVRTADNGPEAIDLYQKNPDYVGAVVLEEHLADLESTAPGSAFQHLKPYVPICLLSHSLEEQRMEELREQGVRYVFTKPFNPDGVACLLQDIVNCAARELQASGVH